MRYFPNVDPAYLYQRKGTADSPYMPRKEEKVLHVTTDQSGTPYYYVTLGEIPDYGTKMKVRDAEGNSFTETNNDNLAPREFRVDYTTGTVHFNGTNSEKLFTFEYLGTGYVKFPAERIVMSDSEMTLQEFARIVKTMETRWHPPVPDFATIATSIPSPTVGDTVQTLNDGKIYRFENGAWTHTQTHTDSAVSDIQNKLAIALEDIDGGSFTDEDDDGALDGGAF